MEKIIVSYTKNWDCEGYCTTQNIKLPKEILMDFNGYLRAKREPIQRKRLISNADADILMYGKPIENLSRCLTQTQLSMLLGFLYGKNIDYSRIIPCRNTMLFVY